MTLVLVEELLAFVEVDGLLDELVIFVGDMDDLVDWLLAFEDDIGGFVEEVGVLDVVEGALVDEDVLRELEDPLQVPDPGLQPVPQ